MILSSCSIRTKCLRVSRSIRACSRFLGYVMLPYVTVLRTRTKKRIMRKIKMMHEKLQEGLVSKETFHSVLTSYLGVVSHARAKETEFSIKKFL